MICVCIAALTALLSFTRERPLTVLALAAVLAGVAALNLYYAVELRAKPIAAPRSWRVLKAALMLLVPIVCHVALPFVQVAAATGRARFPYRRLFEHSWNNAFIVLVGGFVAAALWALFVLWSGAFRLVGISVFGDILSADWFGPVVTPTMFAFGVSRGLPSRPLVVSGHAAGPPS